MKTSFELAVALVHQQLLLLDEPTAGVDPQSREDILKLVRCLRDDGKAILYTTHHMLRPKHYAIDCVSLMKVR